MKKFPCMALLAMTVACISSGCASIGRPDDPWVGADKAKHFAVSAALGAGTVVAAHDQGASDGEAVVLGLGVAMTFGAGKEYYDEDVKKTFWSWRDFCWDILGGLTGSVLASLAD